MKFNLRTRNGNSVVRSIVERNGILKQEGKRENCGIRMRGK